MIFEKLRAKLPQMPTTPPVHEADRTTLLQLSAIIALAVLSHFSIANPVIAVFALLIFALKTAAIWRRKSSPPSIVMMLLTILSIALILFYYGGWNGQTAGISFLVLLVSLKFLESRRLRDYYVVCLILYFLAASTFLFDSSIASIAIIILYTIAITAILFKISTPVQLNWVVASKQSLFIILKALPLAVLLFFFFPRVHGDFGFLPSQDRFNSKELSDSLVAGEMATAAFDTSLAFRVTFSGAIPSRENMYWRSKVMPVERNFHWEILDFTQFNISDAKLKQNAADLSKGEFIYEILHEKSNDKYLPYLDFVAGVSKGKLLADYSAFLPVPEPGPFSYTGSSTLRPSLPNEAKLNRRLYLETESEPTARLQALMTKWRQSAKSEAHLVQLVYQHFTENEFKYSLLPPELQESNPIDGFIFETRTGYCEHYASAFTILMRWLDIPARIVVGYQGGTLNTAGNYMEVRYSDAHAWSEVWLNGQWQRIDPTAAISPERIEFGMEALLELWDGQGFSSNGGAQALSNFLNPTGMRRYLQKAQDSWNNIGYQWQKWVVDYDGQKQRELLSKIGFENRNSYATLIAIMAFGVACFMMFYFWQLIPKTIPVDGTKRIYLQFVKQFRKYGIIKKPDDTPRDFLEKIVRRFPEQSKEMSTIVNNYQQLRYGRQSEHADSGLELFKKQVKQFKLKPSRH